MCKKITRLKNVNLYYYTSNNKLSIARTQHKSVNESYNYRMLEIRSRKKKKSIESRLTRMDNVSGKCNQI